MRIQKFRKRFIVIAISLLIAITTIILICDYSVKKGASGKTFDETNNVPHMKTGILLGTSKYLRNGKINLYYQYRIDAATELINAKKIDYLVISGDNSEKSYDEPNDMKESLIKNGIDSTLIFLDYAGFRTFDSMVRLNKVFGQDSVIVISQKFHNERAIYIAQKLRMSAIGYNASDVDQYYGFKTSLREKAARVKMILDFLFGVKPKFLGQEIKIP